MLPGNSAKKGACWQLKHVTTFDPQAYGPTPFSPRGDPQGSCQSIEQGIASA
jgi:hypothetical protein